MFLIFLVLDAVLGAGSFMSEPYINKVNE